MPLKLCGEPDEKLPRVGSHSDGWLLISAKDPAENRINMPGVIIEIEFVTNIILAQKFTDFRIAEQFLEKIPAMLPDLHRIALNEAVGILP